MAALRRRLAWNVGLVLTGRAVGLALNGLTFMLVARGLGPERFGLYALALAFVTFFSTTLDNGLNIAVTRELARRPASAPVLLGNALVLKAAIGLVLMGLAVSIARLPGLPSELGQVVPVASGLILVTALSVVNAFYQVRLEMGWVITGDFVARLAFLLLALLALADGGGVQAIFLAQVTATALGLLVPLGRAIGLTAPEFRPRFAIWRSLVRSGAVLSLALALGMVASRFDAFILSYYTSDRDLGLYAAGYRIIDLLLLVPALMMQVFFPVLVDRAESHDERLDLGYRRIADLLVMIGLPLAILVAMFARDLLVVAGGLAYAEGNATLAILAWGMLAVFLSNAMYFVMMAAGRITLMLRWSLVGAVAAVAAALVLVPTQGAVGAAIATLGGHAVMLAGGAFEMLRSFGIRPWPRAWPEAIAVGTIAFAVAIAVPRFGGGLLAGAIVIALGTAAVLLASRRTRDDLRSLVAAPGASAGTLAES